ncbi:MAG TPA: hypothetical protein VIW72_04830 [Burkholderiales bacterium]
MPQPIKPGCTLHSHPKAVLERPQHAAGIGLVASEWAALEQHLIIFFRGSLQTFARGAGAGSIVAQLAWDAMEGLKTRLDFVTDCLKNRVSVELLEEFKRDMVPEIRKRAQERNKVVHGIWQLCDEYPTDLICTTPGDPDMQYTVKNFHDIADRINATTNIMVKFWVKVQASPQNM